MINAYFSGIQSILLQYIQTSRKSIDIAVAWFTQRELFTAILEALDRGVSVSIILIDDIINRSEYGLNFSLFIKKGGNLRFANNRTSLMHDKFGIFDHSITITGSYNWTYSAEKRNSENIIITDDKVVVASFLDHFSQLWGCLEPLSSFEIKNVSNAHENDIIRDLDNFADEINCMVSERIIEPLANDAIEKIKKNILVTRLATLQIVNHRKLSTLKQAIGIRCRINGEDNKVLYIIKEGQKLPFTNEVRTQTASDNQTSIICEVVYGNSNEADKNTSLLKIPMDNLPLAKAGEVKFTTKITLDTNGYMHVEYVCLNTGEGKEAVYVNTEFVASE